MNSAHLTPAATLRSLVVFGALRTDAELTVARRALAGRSTRSYRRGLARLLASGTLAPKQADAVRNVLGPVGQQAA